MIVLSVAHRPSAPGREAGATTPDGFNEADFSLDFTRRVHAKLPGSVVYEKPAAGFINNRHVSALGRGIREINAMTDVDLAIEFHLDSVALAEGQRSPDRFTILHNEHHRAREATVKLAKAMIDLRKANGLSTRGVVGGKLDLMRLIGRPRLGFLHDMKHPSVIVELGFITHHDFAKLCRNKRFLDDAATAVAKALAPEVPVTEAAMVLPFAVAPKPLVAIEPKPLVAIYTPTTETEDATDDNGAAFVDSDPVLG